VGVKADLDQLLGFVGAAQPVGTVSPAAVPSTATIPPTVVQRAPSLQVGTSHVFTRGLAMLDPGEAVLPARVAGPWREGAGAEGVRVTFSPGSIVVNVSGADDPKKVAKLVGEEIMKKVELEARTGRLGRIIEDKRR